MVVSVQEKLLAFGSCCLQDVHKQTWNMPSLSSSLLLAKAATGEFLMADLHVLVHTAANMDRLRSAF